MRLIKFSNNAVSRIVAPITNASTTISMTPGDGAKFPDLAAAGSFFMATLIKADGTTEVVKVTARVSDTLTVVRAAEAVAGVTAAYAFNVNDRIEQRLTAGALGNELDRLDAAAVTGAINTNVDYTVTNADVTMLIRVDSTAGTRTIPLPPISSLSDDFDITVAKVTGDANVVNVVRSASDTINGMVVYTLNNQWQSGWFVADRSTGSWTAINSGSGGSSITTDSFTVTTPTDAFTLSGNPGTKNNTAVYINGTYQQKATYAVVGSVLTVGAVLPAGATVECVWAQPVSMGVPSDGTVSTQKLVDGAVTDVKVATGAGIQASKLSFTASVAGSVPRTVQDKLQEYISLTDIGADPTGAIDSRVAVQAAIDSGKHIYVNGIFKIVGSLDFTKLSGMRGIGFNGGASASSGFIFYNTGTSPAVTIPNTKDYIFTSIEDLFFKASSWDVTTGANGHGIDVSGTVAMSRVEVIGFKKIGIFFHHDMTSNGPYESVITNTRCLFSGQHGMVIGRGANSMALINCEWKWNGSTAYLVAPSSAGSFDGLYVDSYDDGTGYPVYLPEGLTVIGGDASYNSRYGYNFQGIAYGNLMPGYAEFNKQATPGNMNLGIDVHDTYVKTGRVAASGVNFAASYAAYQRTNTVIIGGKFYGSGNTNSALKNSFFNSNLYNVLAEDPTQAKLVVINPDPATGNATIGAYGGAVLTIGSGASVALPLVANVQFSGVNTTGAGAALLGSNCPATTLTAPYKWVRVLAADGSTGWLPIWK